MNDYLITLAASARKEIRDLHPEVIGRILARMRELATNPRPVGCKKLRGYRDLWRIRVGDYRIVYSVDDSKKTVDITRIAHRREVYE